MDVKMDVKRLSRYAANAAPYVRHKVPIPSAPAQALLFAEAADDPGLLAAMFEIPDGEALDAYADLAKTLGAAVEDGNIQRVRSLLETDLPKTAKKYGLENEPPTDLLAELAAGIINLPRLSQYVGGEEPEEEAINMVKEHSADFVERTADIIEALGEAERAFMDLMAEKLHNSSKRFVEMVGDTLPAVIKREPHPDEPDTKEHARRAEDLLKRAKRAIKQL